ncbi:hypothetical protein GCM10008018_08690 [Paenibacillus marchantiophytorum]|uniref:Uncharacterized protein n=1 Tax=Paenibacillus marchantiophytorum TaxID=1619310 RepID=A0ABQ2BRZ5_9BACL|nr:hypothetical protein GCM10008018_08690 [Paenibacillus marchantiophytorum]
MSNDSDNECAHSLYITMIEASLTKGINIDYEVIRRAFDRFDPFFNSMAFTNSNQFCLMCISAFDQTGNMELQETAEYIYQKYNYQRAARNSEETAIVTIKLIQIKIRKNGNIEAEDSETLILMKRDFPYKDQPELHFCAIVLLMNKTEAAYTFREFQMQRQEYYRKLPIYHLYSQLQ